MTTLRRTIILSAGLALLAFAVFAREPETPPAAPPPPHPDRDVLIFRAGGSRLGVSLVDIDGERARALKLREESGVEVRAVAPESPAAEAGLKKGDVILTYQGTRVDSAAQLVRMVRETPAGRTVTLEAWRDGGVRELKVKLAAGDHRRVDREFRRHRIVVPPIEIPDIEMPDLPELGSMPTTVRLGASVETLTPQLAEFFGVKDGAGVLVRSVRKGRPGEAAGLRAGDVIVKVDDRAVGDSADLRSAIRGRRGEEAVLTIVRERREQKLTVRLPEGEDTPGVQGPMRRHEREEFERAMEEAQRGLEQAQRELERLHLDPTIAPMIEIFGCDEEDECGPLLEEPIDPDEVEEPGGDDAPEIAIVTPAPATRGPRLRVLPVTAPLSIEVL